MMTEAESPTIPDVTVCPFAVTDPTGARGTRCGANSPATTISSKYAATYCACPQHVSCSIFVAARAAGEAKGPAAVPSSSTRGAALNVPSLVTSLRSGTLVEKAPTERASLLTVFQSRVSTGSRPSARLMAMGLGLVAVLALVFAFPRLNNRPDGTKLTDAPVVQKISQSPAVKQIAQTSEKAIDRAADLVGRRPESAAASNPRPKGVASKPTARKSAAVRKPASKAQTNTRTASASTKRRILSERTVEEGDYLRRIAAKYYGDEMLWPLVWQYNKQRAKQSGQDLRNPDLIYPGWKFYIPKNEESQK